MGETQLRGHARASEIEHPVAMNIFLCLCGIWPTHIGGKI